MAKTKQSESQNKLRADLNLIYSSFPTDLMIEINIRMMIQLKNRYPFFSDRQEARTTKKNIIAIADKMVNR